MLEFRSLHVGDEGVGCIARGCPKLRYLNVKGNTISDLAIHEIAQGCPMLEVRYVAIKIVLDFQFRTELPAAKSSCASSPLGRGP